LPNRQNERCRREGIVLSLSTLADQAGAGFYGIEIAL